MCKRSVDGTYLKVNALPANAQPFIFLFAIPSAVFSK